LVNQICIISERFTGWVNLRTWPAAVPSCAQPTQTVSVVISADRDTSGVRRVSSWEEVGGCDQSRSCASYYIYANV